MSRLYEFDYQSIVSDQLESDAETYVNNLLNEYHGTNFELINEKTARLLYPNETFDEQYYRIAYNAGSLITIKALMYSDLLESKAELLKKSLLFSGVPIIFGEDIQRVKDEINFQSTIGLNNHPELTCISTLIGRYFTSESEDEFIHRPVDQGIGRTAFLLDDFLQRLKSSNLRETYRQESASIDFDSLNWQDLINKN